MFEIIPFSDSAKWDSIVMSYIKYDTYYLNGYVYGFYVHGDGDPVLISYKSDDLKAILVVMVRDISNIGYFKDKLKKGEYFDIAVPYGYGGFIFEGDTSDDRLRAFNEEYDLFLKKERFVSEFIRYNPLLKNYIYMKDYSEIIDLGGTVTLDLATPDLIWDNMSSQYRKKIRRVLKDEIDVEIKVGDEWELFEHLIDLYTKTMDRDGASDYYYFKEDYFKTVYNSLKGHYKIVYAVCDNKVVSALLILCCNEFIHAHLTGTLAEYQQYYIYNYLLYKTALWGNENGYKSLHIGSGLGGHEDQLYQFKKYFNKNSDTRFIIGKRIGDPDLYDYLVGLRAESDSDFDKESNYFPLYRG